jgi:glycerol-3-phosphate dehydrogenase (NAD(P)+)
MNSNNSISIIGTGRWGSFHAWYFSTIKNMNVISCGLKSDPSYLELAETRKNSFISLNDKVKLTSDLQLALHSDTIIIAINSQNLRNLCKDLNQFDLSNKTFVLCMKGLESSTGLRLTEVFEQEIKQNCSLAVWVGPGHVQDFVKNIPNLMLISSKNEEVTKNLVDSFSSQLIRFYYGKDLIGIEIGAATKNVIGLAAGMLDGLGYSTLKGALMARGTREIARLTAAMGGEEMTTYGLSHLGDYEATLFSEHSNNRRYGECVISGCPFTKVAEGVETTRALLELSKKYNVELPITEAVFEIVFNKKAPEETLQSLFVRDIKFEF